MRREKSKSYQAVVIGVSAGGLNALQSILPKLSQGYPRPIIIVQHLSLETDDGFVDYFKNCCALSVCEAIDKAEIGPGVIYFAPAGYHLLVEENKTFSLSVDAPINFSRPSIDVLFESAADAYGNSLVGVVLTGANADGSQGLRRIKDRGGLTVVQDPKTAYAEAMPQAAIQATSVDYILNLEEIGAFLQGI